MSASLTIQHLKYYSVLCAANRLPLIEQIMVQTDTALAAAELELSFSPAVMPILRWSIGTLEAGEHALSLPELACDPQAPALVAEGTPARGRVALMQGEKCLAEAGVDFLWLPGNAWPGPEHCPELLAALVLPQDPAVELLLNRGAEILQEQGLPSAWRGYQGEKNAVINQLHALWAALEEVALCDDSPAPCGLPAEGEWLQLRPPTRLLLGECANAPEAAAYLAAAAAHAGFNPVLVLMPGYACVGVMLQDGSLPAPVERNAGTLRNLLELGEILLLDAPLASREAQSPLPGFAGACALAADHLRALEEGEPFLALDVARLWVSGIRPCESVPSAASPSAAPLAAWPGRRAGGNPADSPFLPEMSPEDKEAALSLVNIRNRTRMEKWQLKLLDLSLRNNLLNSHIDRSQISLLIPHVATLEDALASGQSFTICNLPETQATQAAQAGSAERPEQRRRELLPLATNMFRQQQLLAMSRAGEMSDAQLEKRVKALHDKARKNMEESGSNTLNLACGFLKWTPAGHGDRVLYAPLLLLPVMLKRPSVRAGFRLCSAGDEPGINLTLLELLKTEFGLRIPALEGDLPQDDAGVDVAAILQAVRQAIRDFPGWEVVDLCTLGIFSFAKYLMWVDLKERQESLMGNPIVRHLAASTPTPFPAQVDFPSPSLLDTEADARQIFTPLSADSSQLAAVLAAARGKNFVLIGPPGTGKSQTIANMIAHCLGQGKSVLFVAEKAAALSVVYKRLCRIGLGAFCLELHSNKASKKEVLSQFAGAMEQLSTPAGQTRWELVVSKLLKLRQQLNALPEALHAPYPDGGCLYEDIGYLAASAEQACFCPILTEPVELTAEEHEALLSEAKALALRFSPVESLLPGAAEKMQVTSYSTGWEVETAEALSAGIARVKEWQLKAQELVDALGLNPESTLPHIDELFDILYVGHHTRGGDVRPLLPARAQSSLQCLRHELSLAESYRAAREKLSLPYPDSALDEPQLDQWLREWKIAQISNLISRFFTTRRIRRQLRFLAFSRQQPEALSDLENLIAMRAARDELRSLRQADDSLPQYRKGVEMTLADLQLAEQWAAGLHEAVHLTALAEQWLAGDSPAAPGRPAAVLMEQLFKANNRINDQVEKLNALLVTADPESEEEPEPVFDYDDAEACLPLWESLLELRPRWRELVQWNKQVAGARSAGFSPLVEALLSHSVAPEHLEEAAEWNLRRLRVRHTVDSSLTLSLFARRIQEETIADFGRQDARMMETAASQLLATLSARAQDIHQPDYHAELALLQKEISKQKRHIAPRALLNRAPNVARLLKPCMLMSPLSVAQYLSPDSAPFDVVIFDEASQIPVWDAIGAIGRGSSAVIVGDPRQMPPTSFFSRNASDEELEEDEEGTQDQESILDECLACDIPRMNLAWHYRSKSESLIAFSNHNYYEGKLTTFPAPVSQDNALQYHYVAGTYLKGTRRTNPQEARALVEHVLQTLRSPGYRYTELTSIGIVTFNTAQQALIEDLLDEARAQDESLEPYFSEANPEAVFVKNLENVQGDERGCIYFSTTYGPDEHGAISMNFGPLNVQGGERRLNVAVTRARASMHVFSSLRPEDINLNRTRARGAADLRHFLECASMGVSSYFNTVAPERERRVRQQFAELIAGELRTRGWVCRGNVGVSDFRIDIAVEHPHFPGSMLAGIMLDGPSYRAAHTARDRDILRPGVLQGLGWRLLHLWALDWWRNPQATLERLETQLKAFCTQGPPAMPELPSLLEEG